MDTQTAVAYTIAVHGRLRFDPTANTRLTVTNLMVMGDHGMPEMTAVGELELGTAANPVAADRTAEIVIRNTATGGGVADPEQFGTGIINFGKMTMHGAVMTPTFTRVAVEPRAGHTTLTLSEPAAGWRPGDRLVLPDTRHMKESETTSGGWVNLQNQWEERTVQSIAADGVTITLTAALQFDHLGARNLNNVLEFLPHVGNLTRNVIVRSQSATGTRGHVISVHTAETDIRYAVFRDLGRTTYKPLNTTTNMIGRYPIHMHHNRGPAVPPANGYQFTLVGNAVDGGSVETQFKWGIAVHNSHYGLIQDNVVYNYNGASVATEDGSESYNVFDHNFALRGMGEPNNSVSEARNAMGTEGVGFWFRGPNNYVRNNVGANFQNPTAEAAYGFVYQFIRLGNVAIPNFKGADPAIAGQFTTKNGNNMPVLQFENNEAYGAMQGGFTYWWVSSLDPQPYSNSSVSLIKNLKIWHVYNKAVYHYPAQKVVLDGLVIRGNYSSLSRCCGDGVWFEDYSAKGIVIRNADIQGMEMGIKGPSSGFGPEPNLTVENSVLRNWTNIAVPTPSSVNGCWMQNKLIEVHSTQFLAPPGRSLSAVNMSGPANGSECLTKLDEVRVYSHNGDAATNFQVYHPSSSVLPRPPGTCTPITRTGFNGPTCVIPPKQPGLPTVTFSAAPASITAGASSTLSWTSSDATSVSINQGIGAVAASGTRTVSPTVTTTYTITATNAVGSATALTTVTVSVPTPAPTLTLSASPTEIESGAFATLTWSSTNATSVSINQGIGAVATAGSRNVSPTATTIYTATATGAGGSTTASATVTVTQPPPPLPTATFAAAPVSIIAGQSSTLSWTTSGATSVTLSGVGPVATAGTLTVTPATTTTYTLTASNVTGASTSDATVNVQQPPDDTTAFAHVGLTSGWATFGQVVPQGIARDGISVGEFVTQTDVKNRWPDGSIRFAIVTVHATANGSFAVRPAPASSGTFTPAAVDARVNLNLGGTSYIAVLPPSGGGDAWLSGPLVQEQRYVVTPAAGSTPHPFLRVNFDRRIYNDGQARIDVSVENMLDLTGATTVTYDVEVLVNGAAVFTKAALQHYYLTRWRKVFSTGAAATITPDLDPFYEARALPPYLSMVTNVVSSPTGTAYEVLKSGAVQANMPGHGGRPELAPYPDWTARYLVHKDATQRAFVLANGDLSGSWPIHVREAENSTKSGVGTERFVSLTQRPTIWFDSRAQSNGVDYIRGTPMPIVEYGSLTPGPGQSPLIPNNAHQPSLAYVPYLMTGDRYYAEEMAFWANYAMLRTYNADGVRSSAGILASNEVRGFGWALRNMVDAAAYYPDSSPMKAYLTEKVTNNLTWLDAYANGQDQATNPFTVLWLNKRPEGPQYRGLWEENYLAYAIDRAFQQGFSGGLAHRDAIARFQLLLFSSDPAYPRSAAAPNVVGVGQPSGGGFIYYRTLSEIWAATQAHTRPFAGYYGPEARLNLMIGVDNGWPGAQDAYDYLWPFIGVDPVWGSVSDLAQRAGWALDYYPGTLTPPPPAPEAAVLLDPAPGATLSSSTQTFTWSAGAHVTQYRLLVGTSQGGSEIYAGAATSDLNATVTGLPTDGSTIFVTLSSSSNGSWMHNSYTLTAFQAGIVVMQTVGVNGTGALNAPSLSTTRTGELLIALVSSGGGASTKQVITVSGGGLTWTRAIQANVQPGAAEIWWASVANPTANIVVRSTQRRVNHPQSLTVVRLSGASGVGNVKQANGLNTAPRIQLTTSVANSLVYAVGNDWAVAVPRTIPSGQVKVREWVNTAVSDTYWVQTLVGPVALPVATVLNATAPTNGRWNLAAIEIRK